MRKILAFVLCVLLICAFPAVAFAEGEGSAVDEETSTTVENLPTENETSTEGEISGADQESITTVIGDYLKSHIADISVIVTLIYTIIYEIRKHRSLSGSIGTLNNNAIKVAENSAAAINDALKKAEDIAGIVEGYKKDISILLSEIRDNAEEKQKLEATLHNVETFMKTAKLATLELANEVADLLLLANIPVSKKEELYSRHTSAVNELAAVEEVIKNDGQEA